jgi:hypothetical protein
MNKIKNENTKSKEKDIKKKEYEKPQVIRMRRIVGAGGHKG